MNGFHLVFNNKMRSRTWSHEYAVRVARRMFTLGRRLQVTPPAYSIAATIPWEVSLYSDKSVGGVWQLQPTLVYREVSA